MTEHTTRPDHDGPIDVPGAKLFYRTRGTGPALLTLGKEPANVFGSSLGAVIALDLVTKHPEQVRLLVAHEPALAGLLDEPDRTLLGNRQRDVDATFKRDGLLPAMQKFLAIAGGVRDDPDSELEVQRPSSERAAQHAANLQFFLARDAPAAHRHKLDTTALTAASGKIVPAGGVTSRGSLPHRCGS